MASSVTLRPGEYDPALERRTVYEPAAYRRVTAIVVRSVLDRAKPWLVRTAARRRSSCASRDDSYESGRLDRDDSVAVAIGRQTDQTQHVAAGLALVQQPVRTQVKVARSNRRGQRLRHLHVQQPSGTHPSASSWMTAGTEPSRARS